MGIQTAKLRMFPMDRGLVLRDGALTGSIALSTGDKPLKLKNKKVVFFFPAFSSQEATAPLGILAVCTPLLRAGYTVRIIDSTITPNFQNRVIEEMRDAICLAVSLVTGPMIKETIQVAKAAKALNPDKPVVLGGWHPSLLPDQTLAAACVDVVVEGLGEDALLEI